MVTSARPDAFEAIADPTRRRLLRLIGQAEAGEGPWRRRPRPEGAPVSELVARFEVSQPAISRHLRVLREAGLVSATPDGRRRRYRLTPERLREVDRWLRHFDRYWEDRLDRLGEHLDRAAGAGTGRDA